MIYAIPFGEHAISELALQVKTAEKATWYRRLKIIQLSMAGQTVPKLAEQFDLCQPTDLYQSLQPWRHRRTQTPSSARTPPKGRTTEKRRLGRDSQKNP